MIRRVVPQLCQVPRENLSEPWRMPHDMQLKYNLVIGRDYPPSVLCGIVPSMPAVPLITVEDDEVVDDLELDSSSAMDWQSDDEFQADSTIDIDMVSASPDLPNRSDVIVIDDDG